MKNLSELLNLRISLSKGHSWRIIFENTENGNSFRPLVWRIDQYMDALLNAAYWSESFPLVKDNLAEDLMFAKKVIRSFRSGYNNLQCRPNGEEWEPIDLESDDLDYDRPYYVCLSFKNGSKLPLPIFDEWPSDGTSPGPLQKISIRLANILFSTDARKASGDVKLLIDDYTNNGELMLY